MKVKLVSLFTILLILNMPILTIAQQDMAAVEADATRDATGDAERDVNPVMWLAIGCILPPVVGLLVPYFYKPPVPAGRILGKSPEYVAFYTDAYKRETEKLQFRNASIGCLLSGAAYGGCLFISISQTIAY